MRRTRKEFLIGVGVFLLSLAVYSATCAPTVYWHDSAELTAAAAYLDIPHPSGYPLYTLLASLAAKVPLGNAAQRVNLMSSVFGALTVLILYYILIIIFRRSWDRSFLLMSAGIALAFAFTRTFWAVNTFAETYTLNSLIVAALLFTYLVTDRDGYQKGPILFSLLLGLGLSNHPMVIIMAVLPLGWLQTAEKRSLLNTRNILKAIAAFTLGLTPYLVLPLRGGTGQLPLSWEDPSTLTGFFQYISRARYSTPLYTRSAGEMLDLVALGTGSTMGELGLLAPLALLGLLLLSLPLMNLLLSARFGPTGSAHKFFYYLVPMYLVLTVTAGYGACYVLLFAERVFSEKHLRKLTAGLTALLLVCPIIFIALNWPRNDRGQDLTARDYGSMLLDSLPEGSLFITSHDNPLFLSIYLTYVGNYRSDVLLYPVETLERQARGPDGSRLTRSLARKDPDLFRSSFIGRTVMENLDDLLARGYPVFLNLSTLFDGRSERLVPVSPFVFQLYLEPTPLTDSNMARYVTFWEDFSPLDLTRLSSDPLHPLRREVSGRLMHLGTFFIERGVFAEAGRVLDISIELDPENGASYAKRGLIHHLSDRIPEAVKEYQKAIQVEPRLPEPRANLGFLHLELGQLAQAREQLERARDLAPDTPEIRYNLARTYAGLGEVILARKEMLVLRNLDPDYPGLSELIRSIDR
jgi:tetratricopeptide (TPR) repeat protein